MCDGENANFVVSLEGTRLNVCKNCSKYGTLEINNTPKYVPKLNNKPKYFNQKKFEPKEEKKIIQEPVDGYGIIIKNKREKLDLTQEDFAKQLNEKTSLIQKLESEQTIPSIVLLRKLQKILKVKLIEEIEDKKMSFSKSSSNAMTIGDMIKFS